MTERIIDFLDALVATVGAVDNRYCLVEKRANVNGTNIPYKYTGNGNYQAVNVDGGSISYFRIVNDVSFDVVEGNKAVKNLQANYPIRFVAMVRRDDTNPLTFSQDVANVLEGRNKDLQTQLQAKSVNITVNSINTDTVKIWGDEFAMPLTEPNYTRSMVMIDFNVTVVASRSCWESCDNYPDILQGFDWCGNTAATVDRLTQEQQDCLQVFLCGTCDDATVENSDASYSTTVASGDTLILPDTPILVNGDLVVNQPSTIAKNVAVRYQTQGLVPTTIVGGEVVAPDQLICPTLTIDVYSDIGLTNPITSADFQQVVYIQLHVVGITATEFRFMVFNASDNGVLYVEAGTPLTYTISSFNDLLIYGEATDGVDIAVALNAFELTINSDVDANAYIADHNVLSGMIMGSIQQSTIQGTLQRLKGTGTTNGSDLWTIFKNAGLRIFAYTPVNDTTVSIPAFGLDLIQRATKTFHGYATTDFQVTGLRGGGGKYTKTGMFATSFALNSLGGNVYVRDNTIDGAAFGAIDGANFFSGTNGLMLFFRTVAQNQLSPRSNSAHSAYLTFPDRTGLISIQRSTSSTISFYRNGALINTLTGNNSTTQNPLEIYGHALNANGTPSAYHAAEYAWLCPAMPALTANEMIDYNEVVQYYQENIITGGRNV